MMDRRIQFLKMELDAVQKALKCSQGSNMEQDLPSKRVSENSILSDRTRNATSQV